MKKIVCLSLLLFAGGANSAVIINDRLESTSEGESYAITVDFWRFTMNSAGTASFDVLSWENNFDGSHSDVNASGDFFYIDSMLWLFNDDGSLDVNDLIAENDDSTGYFDGSISSLDSYLSLSLNVGNYILAIGTYGEGVSGIIDGTEFGGLYGSIDGGATSLSTYGGLNPVIDHGDYRITFTGDLTINDPHSVPEPGSLNLLALGLAGLVFSRRLAGTSL